MTPEPAPPALPPAPPAPPAPSAVHAVPLRSAAPAPPRAAEGAAAPPSPPAAIAERPRPAPRPHPVAAGGAAPLPRWADDPPAAAPDPEAAFPALVVRPEGTAATPPGRRAPGDLLRPATPLRPDLVEPPVPVADRHWAPLATPEVPRAAAGRAPGAGRRTAMAAAAVAAIGVAAAGAVFLPGLLGSGGSVSAVFNAPMLVVRSSLAARVMTVAATTGAAVDPLSTLLTVQTNGQNGPETPVRAGVHGVVRSVETVPGADIAAGTPLIRLYDCDRAFLTIPPGARLKASQAVEVKLPGLPSLSGTVRPSTGIMEPPEALVVGLPSGTLPPACPVGATAAVKPAAQG